LAKTLKITTDTLINWELGRYEPPPYRYKMISNFLGYCFYNHTANTLPLRLNYIRCYLFGMKILLLQNTQDLILPLFIIGKMKSIDLLRNQSKNFLKFVVLKFHTRKKKSIFQNVIGNGRFKVYLLRNSYDEQVHYYLGEILRII